MNTTLVFRFNKLKLSTLDDLNQVTDLIILKLSNAMIPKLQDWDPPEVSLKQMLKPL